MDGSADKEFAGNAGDTGDVGTIPGLGRCPGIGNGNPLQYSRLRKISWTEEPGGYSPWGRRESDTAD